MVRIFLSPKFDERGQGMLFKDQRLMMVEIDKFVAACKFDDIVAYFKKLPTQSFSFQ